MRIAWCAVFLGLAIPASADPPEPYRFRTFAGDHDGDRFGAAVALAYGAPKPGTGRVLVGAPDGLVDGVRCGYARVFDGLSGKVLATHIGDAAGDEFGFAVTDLFDIDFECPAGAVFNDPSPDVDAYLAALHEQLGIDARIRTARVDVLTIQSASRPK